MKGGGDNLLFFVDKLVKQALSILYIAPFQLVTVFDFKHTVCRLATK